MLETNGILVLRFFVDRRQAHQARLVHQQSRSRVDDPLLAQVCFGCLALAFSLLVGTTAHLAIHGGIGLD